MDGFTEALLKDSYREQLNADWLLKQKDQRIEELERRIAHLEATLAHIQNEGYRSARRPGN